MIVFFCCPRKTCKDRITVVGKTVTVKQEHEHPPDPEKEANRRILHEINERDANTMEAPQQIVRIAQHSITEETAARTPLYRSLQRNIEKKRKSDQLDYPDPESLEDQEIPDHLSVVDRRRFLLHDSGSDDEERFIMFGTDNNLDIIQEQRNWYADGTFKEAPRVFSQVYTIHA